VIIITIFSYFSPVLSKNKYLACSTNLIEVIWNFLFLWLLYNFWKIVQDRKARTSPAKAVGFLFIPIYTFYWGFVTFFGLSKDFIRYTDRHFSQEQNQLIHKPVKIFSLIFSIFFGISSIYEVYIFIERILIVWQRARIGIGAALQIKLMIGVDSFLVSLFMVLMVIDFYLTAKSILKAEGQA
jgi:hypothetical protein